MPSRDLFISLPCRNGSASAVSAIDRMSLVFVVILAALFLGEEFSWKIGLGSALMVLGGILVVMK